MLAWCRARLDNSVSLPLAAPGLVAVTGLLAFFAGVRPSWLENIWGLACDRDPVRCLHWGSQALPVCARCTGLWLEALVGARARAHGTFLRLHTNAQQQHIASETVEFGGVGQWFDPHAHARTAPDGSLVPRPTPRRARRMRRYHRFRARFSA